MVPSKHDPFKKPTVAEAVCEIHFDYADPKFWESDWGSVLKSQVGSKLPVFETKQIREFRAEIGPEGLKVADKTPSVPRAILKNTKGNVLMQVSPGLLAMNDVSEYRGWETFSQDLKSAWEVIARVARPKTVRRIGLRYINRIPRHNADERVGEWLKSSSYTPERLLAAKSQFMNRMEDSTDAGHRLIVTVAESNEGTARPIILDIDTISETTVGPNWDDIFGVVDRLHDEAWNVFSSTIGPKLKTVLDGGAA